MDSTMTAGIIGAAAGLAGGVAGGWFGANATRWSTLRAERMSAVAGLIGELHRVMALPPGASNDLIVRQTALRLVDPALAAKSSDVISAVLNKTGELTDSVWDDPRLKIEEFLVASERRLNARWWTGSAN